MLASLSPTTAAGYTAASPGPTRIYGVDSGTSMATPHITGSATLVRAIHQDWTPMQVKSALMTTAATAYTTDGSATANPNVAGAGRVDLSKAALASLLFDETVANFTAADPSKGGAPETLNLASYYNFDCNRCLQLSAHRVLGPLGQRQLDHRRHGPARRQLHARQGQPQPRGGRGNDLHFRFRREDRDERPVVLRIAHAHLEQSHAAGPASADRDPHVDRETRSRSIRID